VNLLRNAAQATVERNGPVRDISIRVRRYGDAAVRLEVQDSGVGLEQENLTRIFGHGFTTKSKGHGFGLHSGAHRGEADECGVVGGKPGTRTWGHFYS
jgi:signal transduction histidine kinase